MKKILKKLMHLGEYLHSIIQFQLSWQKIRENTGLQLQSEREVRQKQMNCCLN